MMNDDPQELKYWAFISYSSKDKKWGRWLHKKLENYPIPKEFQGAESARGIVLGKNLRPVFRDRDEFASSSELGLSIQQALEQTHFLIVLCSPNSAQSRWVNEEIENFKAIRDSGNVLALMVDGEPNATSKDHCDDALECFPPLLRFPTEPLAADLRKDGDGKEKGFLKIVAGITGLDFDELYQRHRRARQKRLVKLLCIASALFVAVSWLAAGLYFSKREEERQRSFAEYNDYKSNVNLAAQFFSFGKDGEALQALNTIADSSYAGWELGRLRSLIGERWKIIPIYGELVGTSGDLVYIKRTGSGMERGGNYSFRVVAWNCSDWREEMPLEGIENATVDPDILEVEMNGACIVYYNSQSPVLHLLPIGQEAVSFKIAVSDRLREILKLGWDYTAEFAYDRQAQTLLMQLDKEGEKSAYHISHAGAVSKIDGAFTQPKLTPGDSTTIEVEAKEESVWVRNVASDFASELPMKTGEFDTLIQRGGIYVIREGNQHAEDSIFAPMVSYTEEFCVVGVEYPRLAAYCRICGIRRADQKVVWDHELSTDKYAEIIDIQAVGESAYFLSQSGEISEIGNGDERDIEETVYLNKIGSHRMSPQSYSGQLTVVPNEGIFSGGYWDIDHVSFGYVFSSDALERKFGFLKDTLTESSVISPDGKSLTGIVTDYSFSQGNTRLIVYDIPSGQVSHQMIIPRGLGGGVPSFSEDGTRVIVEGDEYISVFHIDREELICAIRISGYDRDSGLGED